MALFILVVLGMSIASITGKTSKGEYSFAECLTESGTKMYGAYWCTHCNEQKQSFGEDAKYLKYIECSTLDGKGQTQVCIDAGITAYPTWKFGDGTKIEGFLPLEKLSQMSGCKLK